MRTHTSRIRVVHAADEPAGGGTGTQDPPAANLVGEAQRKMREAEARATAAEAEAQRLRDAAEQAADAERSELEKAQKRADAAEAKVSTLEGEIQTRDRSDLVKSALGKLDGVKPHDVDAVLKFVDLTAITDADTAKNAAIAAQTEHPYLFADATPATPPPSAPFGQPAGGAQPTPQIPVGSDGKVDAKAGLGAGILSALDTFKARGGGNPTSGDA